MTRGGKSIWIAVGVVLIIAVTFAWFFGTSILFELQARSIEKSAPICSMTPTPLTDTRVSDSAGKVILIDRYKFELPWSKIEQEEFPQKKNLKNIIANPAGPGVMVYTVPAGNLVNMLKQGTGNSMQAMFGAEAVTSDYAFTKSVLETTPQQIRWTMPRKGAAGRFTMLIIKSTLLPSSAESGMFSIQTPIFSGFQYGDPRKNPKRIVVDLFKDDGEIEFVFARKDGGPGISQADINRVIQSVQKSAAAESPAK